MPCLAASCAVVSSPRSASKATFDLKSAEYRVRLPVIRVRPSRRRTELNHLSEIRGPPQSSARAVRWPWWALVHGYAKSSKLQSISRNDICNRGKTCGGQADWQRLRI